MLGGRKIQPQLQESTVVSTKGSASGSISYVWDHLTYPEMTLSTQQLTLLSLLTILDFPMCRTATYSIAK
jgi:hypothetical protein